MRHVGSVNVVKKDYPWTDFSIPHYECKVCNFTTINYCEMTEHLYQQHYETVPRSLKVVVEHRYTKVKTYI